MTNPLWKAEWDAWDQLVDTGSRRAHDAYHAALMALYMSGECDKRWHDMQLALATRYLEVMEHRWWKRLWRLWRRIFVRDKSS